MADTVRFTPEATQGVVWMSPQQYLDLSPSLKDPDAGKQAKDLKESLAAGDAIHTPSSLTVKDGKVTGQDGRHRAIEAQKAGIRMIPVRVDGDLPEDGKVLGMMGKSVQLDAKALQPKPWREVARSKEYQGLSDDQKEKAKRAYFNDVIAPRVSKKDLEAASAQFQQQTESRVPPTKIDPTEGMSALERGRAGAGKALADPFLGVRSMLPEAVGGASAEEVEERRRLDAPLMATPGGRVGNFLGNAALAVPTAFVPGANTVLGAGLAGAAYGGLQPATSWGERGLNALEGGATAGAVTGAARAVPSIYKALVDPFTSSGVDRIAMDTIGRFAKDPATLTKQGPAELIPGSRATLAETTGDSGIAQLQRAAQANSPEMANALAENKTARIQARKDALLKIAGDQGEKEFFEAARDATANRLYGQAWKAPLDPKAVKAVAPEMKELLERPSIQAARAGALKLAKEEGEVLKPSDMNGGSVKGLHYMKKALDGQIAAAKTAGDDNLVRALKGTQDKLVGVVDRLSPDYKAARATYAADSKPISRMEVGRYLYDKLIPAMTDLGAERITPAKYAAALKEGDEMAKKATGFSGAKLRDVLSSEQIDTLVKLGKDVGREIKAAEHAKVPGSPTAQYLSGKNFLRQLAGPLGMPESWTESALADVLSNRWVSLAAKPLENRIQNRLAELVTNPERAAALANKRPSAPMQALSTGAARALPPAAVAAGLQPTQ